MELITIVIKPAAGPDTPRREPDKNPTTTPPAIPASIPEKTLGIFGIPKPRSKFVDARPTPKQSGNATKKTTRPEGISCRQVLKKSFIKGFDL